MNNRNALASLYEKAKAPKPSKEVSADQVQVDPRIESLGMTENHLAALDTAFADRKKQMKTACANHKLVVAAVEEDKENDSYEYAVENDGCTYEKRNGSKFCQNCSDKHHEKKKAIGVKHKDETTA